MAYRIFRTGDDVSHLLDLVEDKAIYPDATQDEHGLLSIVDKTKLDGLNIKSGTTEYWNSQVGYIPPKDMIIIYTDYQTQVVDEQTINIPGIKIGSGNGYVQDLVYLGEKDTELLMEHIANNDIHVTVADKEKWDNKINIHDYQEVVNETLLITRD